MSYSVRTPFLYWFGLAAILFSCLLALAAFGNWIAMGLFLCLFGGCGAALFFMASHISADEELLVVRRVHNQSSVTWGVITSARIGGGNLVLDTSDGRISLPSFEFWRGSQKMALIALLVRKLQENRVALSPSLKAMFQPGDRRRS